MGEYKNFVAIGEETSRGTKQVSTVGFIPVRNFAPPKPDYMTRKRDEHRGESTQLGHTTEFRMGEKWEGLTLEIPFFTEAGGVAGMMGTLLKHFFGGATSTQNGTTGQYSHMFYPKVDPFGPSNLGNKALTFNMNTMFENTLKNLPYVGGRPRKISFKQEMGDDLIMTVEAMGQKLLTPEAGLSSPTYAAENLRCSYNHMTVRHGGTVTRTGTAPNFTAITSNGNQIKPDSISLEFERGMEDKLRGDGTNTPSKTVVGRFTAKLSMVLDFEDPASGFSSADEFLAWLASSSSANILMTWDTGTQAGTGDNHSLIIDMPICNRQGGMPEPPLDGNPMITLEYDLHFDSATTQYALGILLKNTAATV